MDAQPRISLSPAPLPSLSTASSSGSFPIRAPPTPDDDEASDLDSNDFHDSTNSNCSDIYSNSSSYNGFESGEDYEMALQETFSSEKDDDDSDQDLFVRPFVAESAPDDDIAEESGNVDNNRFFRPFVVYPGDEIVEDGGKNRVFRPFIANPDKDRLFRPFVVDPDDQIVENVLENQLCRPFVADLDKEPMEENCCIDEDQGFSYAAESDEDDADDEICSNLEIKAKDNADSNRFISMPIARLSLEENVSESSVRTVDGSVVETVSIQQFDPLEMESSDQSAAEKDAKEVDFLVESVTDIASIDDNTEKSSNRISDDDEDEDAKSIETASQENEIDDVSQLNPVEEHEDPLNSSSFFNFMDLNPDSWPTAEHPLLETVLCSSEKARLENLQLLKVQFLGFIHKLGYSAEDPTAAHVLNLLDLTANSSSVQQIAIEIDAIEKKRLDFSLNILVLGKSGVGKSSTINSIFQEQKVEIHPFEPGTRTVTEVVGILKNGITVRLFDTPGLKQSAKEQHFNRKTLASVKKLMTDFRIDAVLYIDRLDSYDDSSNDLPLLQTISDSLGVSIWQKVGVVFTHTSLEVPPLRYRDFVSWRQSTIQRCGCVVNPDSILLVENNNACEKSRDRILLFCSSVKTMNEARSSLGVSGGWKWRGDTKVSVDFRSRFGSVVRLDVKRRNWKITVGASLIGCRQGL